MKRVIAIALATLLLSACTVDGQGIRDPLREADGAARQQEVNTKDANDKLTLSIREKNSQVELEARRAEIENQRLKAEAEARSILEIAQAKAVAEQRTIDAQSNVRAGVLNAVGSAGYIAIIILGIGVAISTVIMVTGRSVGYAYNSILAARYVRIGVEGATLLPPPLVITTDGYLIDTRSGERARLRDTAGVDHLRLAATTQSTNLAIMGRTADNIGKSNRGKQSGGAQVADALPGIAASVPLLGIAEIKSNGRQL